MKTTEIERRYHTARIELRASTNGIGVLFGYAAVFNRYSQNLGGFVEQVDPNAFNKSLADAAEVLGRFNHSDDGLLGTTSAETLRLGVDGTGLWYEIDLPDTTTGRDVKALAERGDLRFSSFAFRTMDDEWGYTNEDFPLRTLKAVQLVDVAPVVNPAYRDTTTGLRSLVQRFPAGSCRGSRRGRDGHAGEVVALHRIFPRPRARGTVRRGAGRNPPPA